MLASELIELLNRNMSVSYETFGKALIAARGVSKRYELDVLLNIDKGKFIISSSKGKKNAYTIEEAGEKLDHIFGDNGERDVYSVKPPRDEKPILSEEELKQQEIRDEADWSEEFDDFDPDDWEYHYDREFRN